MGIKEQTEILYHCVAKAHNSLNILKFATKTFELNSGLKTFVVLSIDSYYSMHVNLAIIFDGRKDVLNLRGVIEAKQNILETERQHNIGLYTVLTAEHKATITKMKEIRNSAVSHVAHDISTLDLEQNSMDVQLLIQDLLKLFRNMKGIRPNLNGPLLISEAPKIRDDLGQRKLWNDFIMREMGIIV